MRNALLIAVREFLDNTKTRGFWFGILLRKFWP
jgi:ABC-type Na+ efflux pump permease subunit